MVNGHSAVEFLENAPSKNGSNGAARKAVRMEEDGEISLIDILNTIRKGKWLILGCFAVALGLAATYTALKAPEYEATSILLVDTQQSGPQLGALLGLETGNRNVANEIEILKSRTIATGVAERIMALRTVPGTSESFTVLQSKDEVDLELNDVARRLQGRYVSIRPLGRDVDLVEVAAVSTIPEEAREIADLYAAVYVDYNRTSSRARMSASRTFLGEATEQYSQQLQQAEGDLISFLNRESVVAPEEEGKSILGQIAELQQLQYQTRLQLGVAQAELRGLENEVEQVVPGLAQRISSGDDLVIDRLKETIARLQVEEQQIYARNPQLRTQTPRYGRLVEIDREIASLSDQLMERVEQLVQTAMAGNGVLFPGSSTTEGTASNLMSLRTLQGKITETNIEISGLQASLSLINDGLIDLRARLAEIPNKAIVLKQLERAQLTQEQIYLTLLEKMQEARIAEQSELGYVEVIDHAFAPESPVRPRVPLNLALGGVLGVMFGLGFAFLRSGLDARITRPDDLRKKGYSILGVVPDMRRSVKEDFNGQSHVEIKGRRYDTRLISLLAPLNPISEAYRRVRTGVQYSRPDTPVQTVMVTSSGPGEGKSVTAINLAITMAQAGKRTVYLDADLRRPRGHTMMGVHREPGLVDLLFDASFDMERFATDVDDLYVIPAGMIVPNPAEMLESKRMREVLSRLRQYFDVTIIDTPPILAVTDSLLLSPLCDAVVLVCTANETEWQALDHSAEILHEVGAKIAGVVLNRFDAKGAYGSSGYRYGYGYGDYYGEQVLEKSTNQLA